MIIPVGFGLAAYRFQLQGDPEPMICTMGHDLSAAGSDYAAAAEQLFLAWDGEMLGLMSQAFIFEEVVLYVGQDGGPSAVYESTSPGTPGGDSGTIIPQNSAYLLRKRTSAAGRRGRGRMYIPGVKRSEVGELGDISSSWLSLIQASADGWLDELQNPTVGPYALPPVLLHSEGLSSVPPPTPITALTFENQIATQRQRLRP